MEGGFIFATVFNLVVNLIYTVISLFVAIFVLGVIDKKLLKVIDIQEELKKGNMAVAIFASTVLIFVALIISFGLKS